MTRAALFKQADVAKVLRAAASAGLTVCRVEIDQSGKIVAMFGAEASNAAANEWDEVLDRDKNKRAAGERH
jgi:hypothetical protein